MTQLQFKSNIKQPIFPFLSLKVFCKNSRTPFWGQAGKLGQCGRSMPTLTNIRPGQYLWVVSRIFVVCLEDICRGIGPEICLQVGIISHRLSANDRRLDNANHPEENSKLSERRDAQLAQAQLAVCPWDTLRLTKSRKMHFINDLCCYLYLVQHVKSWTHMESWKDKKGAKSTWLPFPRSLIRTFWPDGPWWPLDLPLNA